MLELKAGEEIEVVGLAADGKEAVRMAEELAPDVVLMDIRMPGMTGIEAAEAICARSPHPKVLALTTFDEEEYALAILRAGASGFLLKDARAPQIINAIRTVYGGGTDLPQELVTKLLSKAGETRTTKKQTEGAPGESETVKGWSGLLPPREEEILRLWTQGLDNQEIARRLCLSEGTVRNYASRLYERLGVKDRAQAVIWAMQHGISAKKED